MSSMINTFGMWLAEMFRGPVLAAADGDQVSLTAVTAIIGAVFAGLGVVAGKVWGKKEAAQMKVRPLPLPVELRDKLATKEDLQEVEEQLGSWIGRVETAMGAERATVRAEQGKLHARMDRVAENLAEIRGEMKQLNANLARLIDRTMNGQ